MMDVVLIHLMLWGQAAGLPLVQPGDGAALRAGDRPPSPPVWTQLGSFVYRHGDRFYNFQGLRSYKEKFDPVWEPRYLAYPGGLSLPRILADATALIAGGYRGIFR